jgi:hypothetical protein
MSGTPRHESSFDATDEAGGHRTLHVFVDVIDAGTMGDQSATIDGLRSIRTEGGEPVNRLSKGHYQVVATGLILTSSADGAP